MPDVTNAPDSLEQDVPDGSTRPDPSEAQQRDADFLSQIAIDPEFKYLLPELDETTFAALEANILEHGCRDPLVLWKDSSQESDNQEDVNQEGFNQDGSNQESLGILIDGHNRFAVLSKHHLPFSTVEMEFKSRDSVVIWMIETQMARRNMTQMQHTHFRGLHYQAEKRIQGTRNQHVQASEKAHSELFQEPTAERLAKTYKVSRETIKRDAQAAAGITAIGEVSSPAKVRILAEEVDITRKKLRELSTADAARVAEVASAIEEGTFELRPSTGDGQTPPDEGHPGSADSPALTLSTAIGVIAKDVQNELKLQAAGDSDIPAEAQAKLIALIDRLKELDEQLYG
ncbi:MAG: hypothetical protein FWC86_04495 [Coriobacteriia bacterium]|nr:hypothetical protein [Coriobacteriia bacterium]